ncbi:MAG: lysylphosphatidylglycerol synthase transmembrane domain-containing protein [Phycisphaerales bacterium]
MPPHDSKQPSRKLNAKGIVLITCKLVISFGLLVYLLSSVELSAIQANITNADPVYLIAALLTPFIGFFLTSLRWKGLLDQQGVSVRQAILFRSCMSAVFFNQLLPSTIGGDVVRVYDSWKAGATKAVALSTIFIDRVLGLTALAIFAVAGLVMINSTSVELRLLPVAVVGVALCLTGSVLMIFSPVRALLDVARRVYRSTPRPISKFFGKLDDAVDVYRGKHKALVRAMLLSLALQLNVILMHFLLGMATGLTPSFYDYFYVVPIALFVMLIPITINGIGLREGMFVYLLAGLGVAREDAITLSLLAFAVFLVHGVIGGIVLAIRGVSLSAITNPAASQNAGHAT